MVSKPLYVISRDSHDIVMVSLDMFKNVLLKMTSNVVVTLSFNAEMVLAHFECNLND